MGPPTRGVGLMPVILALLGALHTCATEQSIGEDLRNWLGHRGSAARNVSLSTGVPVTLEHWAAKTTTDPRVTRLIQEIQEEFDQRNATLIPTSSPIAVNGMILTRTPNRLVVFDVEKGNILWKYPWWESAYPSIRMRQPQVRQRICFDSVFGRISSDGTAAFVIDELHYADDIAAGVERHTRARRTSRRSQLTHNHIVALNLKKGALLWLVGGENGLSEPQLAGAFFLGPPLPWKGRLYVIADINREIRLVVLNASTGEQVWSLYLDRAEEGYVRHHLAGAIPSHSNGRLICPTSTGQIVAIDVGTQSVLWKYDYRRLGHADSQASLNQVPGNGWIDSSVAIDGGSIVATPVDGNCLVCLDVLTGKPKWKPLERQQGLADMLFVASIHDGNVILVGKHNVMAVRIADGKQSWPDVRLGKEDREMPSGRGLQSGHMYYLPTTTNELLKIDLIVGEIVERSPTSHTLGNLIWHRDRVVSQSANTLTVFQPGLGEAR